MSIGNVSVGDKLNGFCNGAFGRDSYGEKTIIALGTYNGNNWVVATEPVYRDGESQLLFLSAFEFSVQDIERWADHKQTLLDAGYSEDEIKEYWDL